MGFLEFINRIATVVKPVADMIVEYWYVPLIVLLALGILWILNTLGFVAGIRGLVGI